MLKTISEPVLLLYNWISVGNSPSKVQPPNKNTQCVIVGSVVGASPPPVCWQWLSCRLTPCSYAISWGIRAWLSRRCAGLLGASKSERLSAVCDARMEPEREQKIVREGSVDMVNNSETPVNAMWEDKKRLKRRRRREKKRKRLWRGYKR